MVFKVQGSLWGVKNGSKTGPKSRLLRGSLSKASWKPLGSLLEPLGAEKKYLGSLLGALGTLLEPKTMPKKSAMGALEPRPRAPYPRTPVRGLHPLNSSIAFGDLA